MVLGVAGEAAPELRQWPLYVAALLSGFAIDFAVTGIRPGVPLGVRDTRHTRAGGARGWPPRLPRRARSAVYVIDAGLAPVGLAVAFASVDSVWGVLLAMPLIALLSVFARERRVRIDHELELRDAYRGTAFLLGDVVEADDEYTGVHS